MEPPERNPNSYTDSPKNHNPSKIINSTWSISWICTQFPRFLSLLWPFHWPFALSLVCGPSISGPLLKGSNFTDLQIIWHTHTQIRCLLCICLVSFYLLFFPSFGCPYFCNIWPILWGNMVPFIADACESWDSVPISAGELWEIFEKLPVFWVFPENSSDGWNSLILMSADTSVLVQIRRTLWKCVSQSSQLCLCCWVVLKRGTRFSFGCNRAGAGGFWFLDPTAAHQT